MELKSLCLSNQAKIPQAVIFDWDNTLVDTFPVIKDALNTTLVTFGLNPWTIQETRMRAKRSLRDSFPGLFGKDWELAAEIFYKRYHEIHIEKMKVIKGAEELIKKLASKGMYLAIVSNKRGDILRSEATHLGWNGYFGSIIGANDTLKDKPAREPVDLALQSSKITAGPHVWFVGDADIDIACAKNAKCTAILLGTADPSHRNPTGALDLNFSNCMTLSNFIDKLYNPAVVS